MRDWKNTPTEELVKKVAVHGYLMALHKMPLDLKDDEYYSSILAEIQKRTEKDWSGYFLGLDNGYREGYNDGYDECYSEYVYDNMYW